jgi:hypothetical protein
MTPPRIEPGYHQGCGNHTCSPPGSELTDRNTECRVAVHNGALPDDTGEEQNQIIQEVSPSGFAYHISESHMR